MIDIKSNLLIIKMKLIIVDNPNIKRKFIYPYKGGWMFERTIKGIRTRKQFRKLADVLAFRREYQNLHFT